jgi:pimeloyl-ACP methyl ester carboxylesterase
VRVLAVTAIGLVSLLLAVNGLLYAGRWWVTRGQADCEDQAPARTRLGAFFAETAALANVLVRLLLPTGDKAAASSSSARGPLVLVPGLGLRARAFATLACRLRQMGWSPLTVKLAPWRLDLGSGAMALDEVVSGLPPAMPEPVVIAFGAGGLVARHYLRTYPGTPVRRLITLGTPHQGTETPLCRFGSLRQLRPNSETMRRLAVDDDLPRRFDIIAISSGFDALVVPRGLAYYPGAFNVEIRDVGHFALIRARRVWGLIAENLRSRSRDEPSAAGAHLE